MTRGLALFALTGCNLVFSLDEVGPEADDVASERVIVRARHVSIENDAAYAPVVLEQPATLADLANPMARVGGREVPVDLVGDHLEFSRAPGEPYAIDVLMLGRPTTFEADAPVLAFEDVLTGRRDAVPLTKPTTMATTLPSPVTRKYLVQTTGVWQQTLFAGNGIADLFGSKDAEPRGNVPIAQLDLARHDRVYLDAVGLDSTSKYTVIRETYAFAANLLDGESISVHSTFEPAPAVGCTQIAANWTGERARLDAASPHTTWTSQETAWGIVAAPAFEHDAGLGHLLAVDADATSQLDVSYPNPFVGTTPMITGGIALHRSIAAPGVPPLDVTIESRTADRLAGTLVCDDDAVSIGPNTVAIPTDRPMIASQVLDADDDTIAIDPDEPTEIAWPVGPGTLDVFVVELYEVGADPENTTTTITKTWTVRSLDTTVRFPAGALEVGKHYIARAISFVGVPDAATGSYAFDGQHQAFAQMLSPTFVTVASSAAPKPRRSSARS